MNATLRSIRSSTCLLVFLLILSGITAPAQGQGLYKAPKELLDAIVFTPDGKGLLSGGLQLSEDAKGTDRAFVKLKDLSNGKERELLKDSLPKVTTMAFAPDGRTLATAMLDKTVVQWDLATGKKLAVRREYMGYISKLIFSPDGKSLVSFGTATLELEPEENDVWVWDIVTGKPRGQLKGHQGLLVAAAFSPDGKTLATAGLDIRLWDPATCKEKMVLTKPIGAACLAFSQDGKSIVAGNVDWSVRVWDLATKKERAVLKGHRGTVLDVAFVNEDTMALSRSEDGTVRIWDLATGEERNQVDLGLSKGLDLPNFKESGRLVIGHNKDKARLSAISPDRRWLAVGKDDGAATFYDLVKLRVPPPPVPPERMTLRGGMHAVTSVAFSPDGKKVAGGGAERDGLDNRGMVMIWDVATGKRASQFQAGDAAVRSLSWSPDGQRMVTVGGKDKKVHLWDVATRRELAAWEGHTDEVRKVAFSPDGKLVASGSQDGTVRLWDSSTGKAKFALKGFTRISGNLAFAPDGKRLLIGGVDQELHLFDVETGKQLATWRQIEVVDSLAFAPDGNTVAVGTRVLLPLIGGGMVILWDLNKAKERTRWQVDREHVVLTVAFSPDGRWLATGDSGNEVQVWEVATRKRQAKLPGHRQMVGSVAWNPDCKTLASGSYDGTVRLWDATAITAQSAPR
jgi:WD40 repeat protein